ncbi:MAG: ferredoxin oxidoreductase, partial [Candidatus Bathyarchaeia archaeon]
MQRTAAQRLVLSGNLALAYAVKQLDVDVVPAYPITPSTIVVERISKYVADGEMKGKLLLVESEHSAISAALAAGAAGARVFTATSSQGLLLMHEVLFATAGLRIPVVMGIANRAISVPINILNDHSDVMAQRDSGWIQIFAESIQELYDKTIQAFRVAEDTAVRLPVMVNYDGYLLSHAYEVFSPLEDREVAEFCPRTASPFRLSPSESVTVGAFHSDEHYFEAKYSSARGLEDST